LEQVGFLVEGKRGETCEFWSLKENLPFQMEFWPRIHGQKKYCKIRSSFPWKLAEIIPKDTILPLMLFLRLQILLDSK